jgi:integrase
MIDRQERQHRLPKEYGDGENHCGLHDARNEASKIRALARQGIDYQIQLQRDKDAETERLARLQAENLTVANLFDVWVLSVNRNDDGAELRRSFGRDVLPHIGKTPLKEIVEDDIKAVLNAVVARGANRLAVMMLADLKQMFRWGEKRKPWKLLIDNPAEGLDAEKITSKDYDGSERTRTLSPEEIRELTIKLPAAGLLKRTEIAVWIMLACCCRIGEIVKAKWEHIDLDTAVWTIPKENAKNKVAHTVYLSDFALSYFRQLRDLSGMSMWCFPDAGGMNHVCIKSTTKQIRDRQLSAMDRKSMANRSKRADALILSNGDWVPHDLRRTGATMMQSLGIAPIVIEKVLNHVEPNKLKRTYQTHDYADEKREAWKLLGQRLTLVVTREGSNITAIYGEAKAA